MTPAISRRAATVGLGALAATLAVGPAGAATAATISIPSTEPEDSAYFVALQKGYFAAEGLDMSFTFAGGGIATPALLSGSILGSASSASALSAILRGADLRILIVYGDSPAYQVWALKDIHTLADLKGKSIGIQTRGDTFEIATRIALETAGIPGDAVGYTPLGFGDAVGAALASGAIPAVCTSASNAQELLGQGQLKNAHLVMDYMGKVKMPWNGFVVGQKSIAENPALVHGMIRAIVKGTRYARAFKDQALAVVAKYQKIPNATANNLDYDDWIREMSPSLTVATDICARDLAVRADLLHLTKDRIPPLERVYDFSIVRSVNAELDASRWKPS